MKQTERIFILPRHEGDLKIVSLPHPRTGVIARFMVRSGEVLEIQKVSEPYRTWFRDDSVVRDGSLFISTPVDPLFLLLPLLEKNRKATPENAGYFCELDQILTEDEAYPGYHNFLDWPALRLSLICDVKEQGSKTFYRLNDDKVIKWLQAKVQKLKNYLGSSPELASSMRGGARAANYNATPITDADLVKAAVGLLSDYVKEAWQIKLCESLSIPLVHGASKTVQTHNTGLSEKAYGGGDAYEFEEDEIGKYAYSGAAQTPEAKKTPQKSLAQRKLEKVDKRGMPAITSFFKKKDT